MSCNGFIGTFLGRVVAATCLFGSMGLGYIPMCTGASVGITKATMVHQHDLSSHPPDGARQARFSILS